MNNDFEREISRAFVKLSNRRGMGYNYPLPLPLTEVLCYCVDILGVENHQDKVEYTTLIMEMDEEYLEYHKENNQG